MTTPTTEETLDRTHIPGSDTPLATRVGRIVALGAPLLAGNMSQYLMRIIDLAMLGRLGTVTLAAASIGTMTTGVLFTLAWPNLLGAQAVTSRRFGRAASRGESAAHAGTVLGEASVVALGTAGIALVLSTLVPGILRLLISDLAVRGQAADYVMTVRWSVLLMAVAAAHRGFLGAVHRTGVVMAATVVGNAANVFFNWVLIFGNLGFPAMGIRGAALGTVAADALAAIILVSYARLAPALREFALRTLATPQRALVRTMIRVMAPPALQNSAALLVFLAFQSMVERISTEALAVTGLMFALFRINKTIVGGFANGAAILVGNALGADAPNAARKVVLAQQALAGGIAVLVLIFIVAAPGLVLALFGVEPGLHDLGYLGLRFFAPFFFVEVLGYSFEIVFTHNGWGRFVFASEATTNLLFILGLSALLVFGFGFGVLGAWTGFASYQLSHALVLWAGFRSGRWLDVQLDGAAEQAHG